MPSGNTSDGTNTTRIRQQSTSEATPSSGPAPAVTTSESTPARPMTRSRADTAGPVLAVRNPSSTGPARSNSADANDAANGKNNPLPSIRFIPHFDPRANRPSLSFPAVTRTLPNPTALIKVGRYSERETPEHPTPSHAPPSSAPIGFKSKVVSRRHCEFWCQNSQWYIKDVKSSSGTFLNHVRLSPPGQESRAFAVNDGDVVQLGIDFRGGEEMIFRCVKIRVEVNRGWQKGLNEFKYVVFDPYSHFDVEMSGRMLRANKNRLQQENPQTTPRAPEEAEEPR
ncbi:MAG: FHA domain-containing protein [Terriglobus roseus]|nr:FHA domain-containing protein [Terriglobus roseus]